MRSPGLLLLAGMGAACMGLAGTGLGIAATPEFAAVTMRAGQHPGFGRLVFDLPDGTQWRHSVQGNRVVLQFSAPLRLEPGPALPRNVLAVAADGDSAATVRLATGVRAHAWQMGEWVILDALDPAHPEPASSPKALPATTGPNVASSGSTSTPAAPASVQPANPPLPTAAPAQPMTPPAASGGTTQAPLPSPPPASVPAATPVPAASATAASPPVPALPAGDGTATSLALAVRHAALPAGQQGSAIVVPFEAGVGAAALVRAGTLLVVFDAPKPLDVAALRDDPVFATATVEELPTATLLRLQPPPGLGAVLTREAGGWRLALAHGQAASRSISASATAGGLLLAAAQPGRVVAITDPVGDGTLLVGTQLQDGQADQVARQAPEFALLPTFQGVAVEPLSDRLQLARVKDGFRLTDAGGPLALAPETLADNVAARAAALTRRFDLPAMPMEALRRRLDGQLAAAADAPPLARGQPRLAVARTMIALGMDQEALGALRTAAAADPRLADDPDLLGLEEIAAVLAGRPEQAAGLLDPRLTGTDEVALWRALRDAMAAPTPQAAHQAAEVLAATAPLLLTYPAAMQALPLPLALETMADAGQPRATAPLLAARPDDPRLALARAMVAQAEGDIPTALKGYDALASGRDRLTRLRAAMRAIDLRLAEKQMTPTEGLQALERLDAAWRGDRYELARRERMAELQLQTGAWRPALALLRESAARFPDEAPRLRERMQEAVGRLLRDDATRAMPPLDFVALLDENADLLGAAAASPDLQGRLADRLLALDLPDAAAPLLERLMRAAPPDAGRAATGARLAALRLATGDAPGALSALSDSQAEGLPASLVERRALLSADATARTGDIAQAAATLAALGTPAADRARADILERAGDLPGAIAALNALADRTVPPQGKLDEANRATMLHLAALAARAGDPATLAALRMHVGGRLEAGPDADTIRLLLAEPVRQVADLARAAKEATLAGTVAADLRTPAVTAVSQVAR